MITQAGYSLSEAIKIINQYFMNQFKKLCNPCLHNNPISFINKNCYPFPTLSRKEQVICSRLFLRVTKITHLHILTKSDPKVCEFCNIIITLEHIFIYCPNYNLERQNLLSYLTSNNIPLHLDDILNGQIPNDILLAFIHSISLSNEI